MTLYKKIIVSLVVVLFLTTALSVVNTGARTPGSLKSPALNSPQASGASLPNLTYSNVTFTGNASYDFPAGALLYKNLVDPWGSGNNVVNLYGTWNETELFVAVDGAIFGGNNFMLAISNNSAYGTMNLSTNNLGVYERNITFTEPMNFFFFVSGSTLNTVSAYEVTSLANKSTVFVPISPAPRIYDNLSTGLVIEIGLNFSTIFPTFPAGAKVSLYSSVFGGVGPYVGPTIPSGQAYGVNYFTPNLVSHDVGNYVLENAFYTLYLDPNNLGIPEQGILPNYVDGLAFHNVLFTGNPSSDFKPSEKSMMNTNTMWGSTNLINSSYMSWNYTTLFIGINASVQNNYVYAFLSNNTGSGYGAYNLTNFANITVSSNEHSYGRNIVFTRPVNYVIAVQYNSFFIPSILGAYKIVSTTAQSNVSVALRNVTSTIGSDVTRTGLEFSMPFEMLFNISSTWAAGTGPLFVPYSSVSMAAVVVGGQGGAYVGPTLPAGQGGAYTGYYNSYHTVGPYSGGSDLINTFFTEAIDPYGQGVPAVQISPVYTYGFTYHNVKFTGRVASDFAAPEIIGNNSATPWGIGNTITRLYMTWNYTHLFVGVNATVGTGNNLMVAISNGTNTGRVNLSKTNVVALQRNITFTQYVNFIYTQAAGNTPGYLYKVIPGQTNSTQTNFSLVGTFPSAADGSEFSINFNTLFPNQTAVAGQFAVPIGASISLAAAIYGGGGPWVGPTIPAGQTYTGSGSAWENINSFIIKDIDPYMDGYANPGIMPSFIPVRYSGAPINLNIVFNDHQPLYGAVGSDYWMLPWTAVHLAEYMEQALLLRMYPGVNITYSLSGSLLYQIEAIAHGAYNNSYLMAAFIPQSQWSNTLYQQINQYGDTFLTSFAAQSQWNSTTVRDVLEYSLAFNTPSWVYSAGTPASNLYSQLYSNESAHVQLSNASLTNALAEFFLWSLSYPTFTGMLGMQHIEPTIWNLYNQTSFTIGDIATIAHYYEVEANLTIAEFKAGMISLSNPTGNVELLTTPFDHPILPLLLMNNWTGGTGDVVTKGVWTNDLIAQLAIGKQIFNSTFGQNPVGLWSPEQVVSSDIIQYLNQSGYIWTSSADSTLAGAGISVPSAFAPSAQQMENLYTPYNISINGSSVAMVFRDSTLSNDWGFNYGNMASSQGNWAPVNSFISYLKNVYATVPRFDHSNITVTVALDGENWMFMSPFPMDGVPFIQDLYLALEQNSSWLHTTTVQQLLATKPVMPTLTSLPLGSWNSQPTGSGVSQWVGQWAGHQPQDATWEQLALVRSMIVSYGQQHGLSQPMSFTTLQASNYYPFLGQWNLTTAQDKYNRAWMDIYAAEGSDTYFAFNPADQNLAAQNAIVFEGILRQELSDALTILGLPLTPFLKANWTSPVNPSLYGSNSSITPPMSGSLYNTAQNTGGISYSVNNNFAWNGSYQYKAGGPSTSLGINTIYYAFDPNNLYFGISVNGNTRDYAAPNAYSAAPLAIQIYLTQVNPGTGNVAGLSIPNSVFATTSGLPLGFAAGYMITIQGVSVTPSGTANVVVYNSGLSGNWIYNTSLPSGYVGGILELSVPLRNLNMIPGNSITFSVATVNQTTEATDLAGPLSVQVPASLAKLTLVSAIHNTALDNGPGNYTYPLLTAAYTPGSVDMQWVNVSMNSFLVQFNITFGSLELYAPFGGDYGFSIPIVDIYIHTANGTAGNTAMLQGPNANVTSSFAWQWVIQACGFAANSYVENYQGQQYPSSVLISSNLSTRTVSIQVPLSMIGTSVLNYGYVIVAGFQDGYGTNGWKAVYPVADTYHGAGWSNPNSPNIYSYIAPNMVNSSSTVTQQSALSTFTTTQLAQLPGIYLPHTQAPVKSTGVIRPTNSAVGYNQLTSRYMSFYNINKTVFWTTSSDGKIWGAPAKLFSSTTNITGMSFFSQSGLSYLLATSKNTLWFVNMTSSPAVSAFQLNYTVKDSAGAVFNNLPYAFLYDGTNLRAYNMTGDQIGSTPLAATNISAYSGGSTTYVAYTNSSTVSIMTVTLTASKATFNSNAFTFIQKTNATTIGRLSLVVNKYDQFIVGYVAINSSGSNIVLAYGNMTTTHYVIVTSDGFDDYPSVIATVSGNTTTASVQFTSSSGQGNVYFIPSNVASFTYTAPAPPSTAPGVPPIAIVLLVLAALLVVAGVVAYRFYSKRE